MRNVPPHSVVMGNPARVMEQNIQTGRWGIRIRDLESVPPHIVPDSQAKASLQAAS